MADLVFVSVLVAFFALCVVYLKWCDQIIGPDELGAVRNATESQYVATGPTLVDASGAAEVTA